MRNQLDIFDHDPARLAQANRDAADQALKDMQFPTTIRLERAAHYTAEAERLEALANLCNPSAAPRIAPCIQFQKEPARG